MCVFTESFGLITFLITQQLKWIGTQKKNSLSYFPLRQQVMCVNARVEAYKWLFIQRKEIHLIFVGFLPIFSFAITFYPSKNDPEV